MKALGATDLPAEADAWHAEIKFDGYRAIALLEDHSAVLWSRNHKPLGYPALLSGLAKLRCRSAVLDGEIVALDAKGNSRFQLLQNRGNDQSSPVVYYVFDLLQLNGTSLVTEPIERRRAALVKLIGRAKGMIRLSPVFEVAPAKLLAEARRSGLEGIVLKRRESAYEPGQRSGTWLKIKNLNEQEFVIGGFSPPQRSRVSFGAILVGYYESGQLRYAGKVGTGFDTRRLQDLHRTFLARTRQTCPFTNLPLERKSRFGTGMPRSEMARMTWIRPDLVAQVRFTEWTQDGMLRQPVFLGMRNDKPAKAVRREAPAASSE